MSHTRGRILERIYKKDQEFVAYMKEISGVRFQHIINPIAYLLPPDRRTVARFPNLSPVAERSGKILDNFH